MLKATQLALPGNEDSSKLMTIPACGNGPEYWMDAYPGGLCYPIVGYVHPARHRLRQPISDGISLATPVLPGNLYGRCFYLSRLWNRSVFSVSVQLGLHGSGAGSASESATREIPSLF